MTIDYVCLWKAPSPQCADPVREISDGFDPRNYPGEGVFLATLLVIAQDFQRGYQNGLQEIELPREVFADLIFRQILLPDYYYPEDQSWHVPEVRLNEFNEIVRNTGIGRYYSESTEESSHD